MNDPNFDPRHAAARRRWTTVNAVIMFSGGCFMLATRHYVLPSLENESELRAVAYVLRCLTVASLVLLSPMFAVLAWQTISLSVKLGRYDRERRKMTEEFLRAQERSGYEIKAELRNFFLNEIDVRDARRRSSDDTIRSAREGKLT